jgi:L-alanine-DL-glutamate epimerase-like enolase superfamily enzyme
MELRLLETELGLRNSTTRLPFRYGTACMTRCPQAILRATVEVDGVCQFGYSGDCLPPSWFDKRPQVDYRQQIADMVASARLAGELFRERFQTAAAFFPGWLEAQDEMQRQAVPRGWPGLLASFGVSLVERAMIDAACRAAGCSFAELVRQNLLAIDGGQVNVQLQGLAPRDWLPHSPARRVYVRHTVGLADPLTTAEIPTDERLHDGLPQSLEEYLAQTGIRYLKVKVGNDLPRDRQRLETIAQLAAQYRGDDFRITLDGNEQYAAPGDLDALIDLIHRTPSLATLWRNTLLIEQPLPRGIALDPAHTEAIRRLAREKPVIIDESDERLDSYPQALALGYRGVSSKNCKGAIKSLLNAGRTWFMARDPALSLAAARPVMTGEDLCCVGIVPVQSDLCLAAALGLEHVERNGHHYHRGLGYLPDDQQQAALAAHPDLYEADGASVRLAVRDGCLEIGSLQCVGFGFQVLPDFDRLTPADQWRFESLVE